MRVFRASGGAPLATRIGQNPRVRVHVRHQAQAPSTSSVPHTTAPRSAASPSPASSPTDRRSCTAPTSATTRADAPSPTRHASRSDQEALATRSCARRTITRARATAARLDASCNATAPLTMSVAPAEVTLSGRSSITSASYPCGAGDGTRGGSRSRGSAGQGHDQALALLRMLLRQARGRSPRASPR